MASNSRVMTAYPDSERLTALGLDPRLSGIPTLIWSGNRLTPGEVHHAAREFMEARAGLSSQAVGYHPLLEPRRKLNDSLETTKAVAQSLANFLSYCIRSHVNWRDVSVGHKGARPSVLHWAYASLDGSGGQSAVLPGTLERRFYYVQHFLWWAGNEKYRAPYEPIEHHFVRGIRPKTRVEEMVGIPSEGDVQRWLETIESRFIWQNSLMIRLGLEAGLRSKETRYLRASRIPFRSILQGGGRPTSMGALGDPSMDIFEIQIDAEDGTKYGKARTIWVPSGLMICLQAWRRLKSHRPLAIRKLRDKYPIAEEPIQLFFNPTTGRPWGKNHINDDVIKETAIVAGLGSTHKLRHYFASRFMLRHLVRAIRMTKEISGKDTGLLLDGALDEAELQLQMQLGHSHGSSTMVYRKWTREQFLLNEFGQPR